MTERKRLRRETRLLHYGRPPPPGPANPPVIRASTILHDDPQSYADTLARRASDDSVLSYGRRGTTTAHALMEAIADLEGGDGCWLFPSGVAAIATTLRAFLQPGDHLLLTENAFHATRTVCEAFLAPHGIEATTIPWSAASLDDWLRPTTRVLFAESPASNTLEVLDLPALTQSARAAGVTVIADNTYGSGWLYQPLKLGCDISIIAGTKYLSGHADVMMGAATARGAAVKPLRAAVLASGQTLAPDEAYATLRGMRTLGIRLERHQESALRALEWFSNQSYVERLFHPALSTHPGHASWHRDASGTNGLISVVFREEFDHEAFLSRLQLFAFGSSWGGFESLVKAFVLDDREGIRFHIGLEHIDDLLADLEQAAEYARNRTAS